MSTHPAQGTHLSIEGEPVPGAVLSGLTIHGFPVVMAQDGAFPDLGEVKFGSLRGEVGVSWTAPAAHRRKRRKHRRSSRSPRSLLFDVRTMLISRFLRVTLNGRDVSGQCYCCDVVRGIAWLYKHRNGHPYLTGDGEVAKRIAHGVVRVALRPDVRGRDLRKFLAQSFSRNVPKRLRMRSAVPRPDSTPGSEGGTP